MFSNRLFTPLRYPGGKARFAPYVADVMRNNKLDGGHYLEPYAGGAGVALDLLYSGIASEVHINDADPAIRDFWLAATKHTSQLIRMVETEPVTIEAWRHWRAIMNHQIEADELKRGFATLFLNRTNRSGILNGGVIGGKEQAGEYKIDARFIRKNLVQRLEKIGQHAERIHVYGEDALGLLNRCADFLPKHSLIYLDPPYYVKGQRLYRNFYGHNDHLEIANLLQANKFPRKWIVSYDDAPEIRKMYHKSEFRSYLLHYTARRQYKGSEVMIFSQEIKDIPNSDLLAA